LDQPTLFVDLLLLFVARTPLVIQGTSEGAFVDIQSHLLEERISDSVTLEIRNLLATFHIKGNSSVKVEESADKAPTLSFAVQEHAVAKFVLQELDVLANRVIQRNIPHTSPQNRGDFEKLGNFLALQLHVFTAIHIALWKLVDLNLISADSAMQHPIKAMINALLENAIDSVEKHFLKAAGFSQLARFLHMLESFFQVPSTSALAYDISETLQLLPEKAPSPLFLCKEVSHALLLIETQTLNRLAELLKTALDTGNVQTNGKRSLYK